ncbi:MAG: T9SS type A sorting domain-containing protein [Flavipsychrobacter sp.]|nr:T9SS type A sorting domain-containing protein [Flavipsychrobacter sp.]
MKQKFYPSKLVLCGALVLLSAVKSFGQASAAVLEEWPFTLNNLDSTSVRATGVVGTVPTLTHLYLSTSSSVLPYSPAHGQAISAGTTSPGDGSWSSSAGGPGGTSNRNIYEQFQLIPSTGYSMNVDSFIVNAGFISTASSTSMIIVYSLSNFVSDSTVIPGYTFGLASGQVFVAQANTAPLPTYRLGLAPGAGVAVPAGDTLTVRFYMTCSSNSSGRYFQLLDVIAEGTVTPSSSTPCLSQPGAIVASIPTICAGQVGAIYSVPAVTGAASYTWTYSGSGATFTSTTDSVTVNYANNATSGTLSVVANAACGSSTARTSAITVNALPSNTITTNTGGSTICSGGSLTLNASTGTGYTYQFLQNNTVLTGATNATYTATSTGAYTVKINTSAGCTDTSAALNVTTGLVPPLPVITPAGPISFCTGGSAILSITPLSGNHYQWLKNGVAATDTLGVDTIYAAGSYTVKATSASGCADTSAAVVITVNAFPVSTITPSGSVALCGTNTVTLNVPSTSGATYQWLDNGVVISSATTNSYTAAATGAYTVSVTSNSCTDTSSPVNVTVNAYPADAVTAAGATTFCAGSSVALNASTVSGATYQWLNNGTPITGASAGSYTANASGQYSVIVTANTCTDTSAATTVTVNPLPTPVITENTFTLSAGTFTTYQWIFNSTNVATTPTLDANVNGNGSYKITVTDGNGCSNTSAVYTVTDVTGVNNVYAQAVKLYPNPATSVLYINSPIKVNVAIAGIDGKQLLFQNNAATINIANLANGIYLVMIYDENNMLIKTDKLVKN